MNYTTQLRNQVERKDEMNIQAGECEIVLLNLFVNLSKYKPPKIPTTDLGSKEGACRVGLSMHCNVNVKDERPQEALTGQPTEIL